MLAKGTGYVEEAIEMRRRLGPQADLATALNNASNRYSELAELETSKRRRAELLGKGAGYVEEGAAIYRRLGLQSDLAMALSNASVCYSKLAELETSKKRRAELLHKGTGYVEEAIEIRRRLGLQADLATALNNASNRYSELAGLETSKRRRAELLGKGAGYVEEAAAIYRRRGLQADLAMALNNACHRYSELAALETSKKRRAELLGKGAGYVEEAATVYRRLGLQVELATALNNASGCYIELARLETSEKRWAELLGKGTGYVEEAIEIGRRLGLQAELAMALTNASNCYSGLAGLQTSKKRRAELLGKAAGYVEEAAAIYRRLGLQAKLAGTLNNASDSCRQLAGLQTSKKRRAELLGKGVGYVGEAATVYRRLGLQAELAMALGTDCSLHLAVADGAMSTPEREQHVMRALNSITEAVVLLRGVGNARLLLSALYHEVVCLVTLGNLKEDYDRARLCSRSREGGTLARQMDDARLSEFFSGTATIFCELRKMRYVSGDKGA